MAALGVIVCTRPDAVVLYFGHNNVWDIRVAENNRDRLLTFDEVWERLRASSAADGPGVRSPGFTPDGTTEITLDLAHLSGHLVQGLLRDGRRELRPGVPAPMALRITRSRFRPPGSRGARASGSHRHRDMRGVVPHRGRHRNARDLRRDDIRSGLDADDRHRWRPDQGTVRPRSAHPGPGSCRRVKRNRR